MRDWLVLAGSLPPGAPVEWYAELCRGLLADTPARVSRRHQRTRRCVALVASGCPDAAADLMKPNGEELASLTGGDADQIEADPGAAASAAGLLVERGVGAVLATLGAHGAVLVTPEGAWHATPRPRCR